MKKTANWSIAKAWESWIYQKGMNFSQVARKLSEAGGEKISAAQVRNMTLTEGWGVRFLQLIKQVFPELSLEWLIRGEGEQEHRPLVAIDFKNKLERKQNKELLAKNQLFESQLNKQKIKYQKLAEEHMELLRKYAGLMESQDRQSNREELKELTRELRNQTSRLKMFIDEKQYQ